MGEKRRARNARIVNQRAQARASGRPPCLPPMIAFAAALVAHSWAYAQIAQWIA